MLNEIMLRFARFLETWGVPAAGASVVAFCIGIGLWTDSVLLVAIGVTIAPVIAAVLVAKADAKWSFT